MAMTTVTPKVVLGVAAHPDDLDYYAGGAVAQLTAAGAKVYYLILTDGSKGLTHTTGATTDLPALRQDEQRAALRQLGGADVRFCNHCDCELEVTQAVKNEIVAVVRDLRPDLVITFDPSMIYAADFGLINHSDHRAAGQATLDAIYPLARDHTPGDGVKPHKTDEVWLINLTNPNHYVDITDCFEQKLVAVAAHKSQFPDRHAIEQRLRAENSTTGKAAQCALAESFVKIVIK